MTASAAERIWLIVSIVCLIVAGVFLLRGNHETVFVAGALGAVSWLLGYRIKIVGRQASETEDPDADADEEPEELDTAREGES